MIEICCHPLEEPYDDTASARHFRKSVRKSANCGLKVLVCGFANRFLTANICGFAVEKLKFNANQQHRWDCFFVISPPKNVFTIQCIDRFGWRYLYSTTPPCQVLLLWNDNFSWVQLFKWQRVARNDFDDMPSTSSA